MLKWVLTTHNLKILAIQCAIPVKEYLDVLDFKLLNKNVYSFYDDKSNPNIITNLASASNTISFASNDPLSKLPASAILNTTIKDLTKEKPDAGWVGLVRI